jgi:NADPH2:quinone reductase
LNLVLLKGISVMGFENRTILDHLPDLAAAHRAEVLRLLLDGRIRTSEAPIRSRTLSRR